MRGVVPFDDSGREGREGGEAEKSPDWRVERGGRRSLHGGCMGERGGGERGMSREVWLETRRKVP